MAEALFDASAAGDADPAVAAAEDATLAPLKAKAAGEEDTAWP